jgi:hypothetical protein
VCCETINWWYWSDLYDRSSGKGCNVKLLTDSVLSCCRYITDAKKGHLVADILVMFQLSMGCVVELLMGYERFCAVMTA